MVENFDEFDEWPAIYQGFSLQTFISLCFSFESFTHQAFVYDSFVKVFSVKFLHYTVMQICNSSIIL